MNIRNFLKKFKNIIFLSFLFTIILQMDFINSYATIEKKYFKRVVPSGKAVGLILNRKSPIVINISDVVLKNGQRYSPAKKAGIKNGDKILKVDNKEIKESEDILKILEEKQYKEIEIVIDRNGKTIQTKTNAVLSELDNKYKLGIWLNDVAAGIGTITFYDPDSGKFASLGHPILDNHFGNVVEVDKGGVFRTEIMQINKSASGKAGELIGCFLKTCDKKGIILKNTNFGLFGKLYEKNLNDYDSGLCESLEVASKEEIKTGCACILSNVEGENVERFDVKIEKVIKQKNKEQKGLVIKITDNNLLEKTGGIVQGMSGSPIIQNGKLVGALTHVIVNDPSRGFGIFAECMIKDIKDI